MHKRSNDSVVVAQKLGGALASGLALLPPRLDDGSSPCREVTFPACKGR